MEKTINYLQGYDVAYNANMKNHTKNIGRDWPLNLTDVETVEWIYGYHDGWDDSDCDKDEEEVCRFCDNDSIIRSDNYCSKCGRDLNWDM